MTLAYAVREANRDWQYRLDCHHLLRGLLRFPNWACEALRQVGIDLTSVRAAAKLHGRQHTSIPAPKWGYLKLAIDRSGPLAIWLALACGSRYRSYCEDQRTRVTQSGCALPFYVFTERGILRVIHDFSLGGCGDRLCHQEGRGYHPDSLDRGLAEFSDLK